MLRTNSSTTRAQEQLRVLRSEPRRSRWAGLALVAVPVIVACLAASCAGPSQAQSRAVASPATLVHRLESTEAQDYSWGWIRWLLNSEIDPQAEMTFGVVQVEAHQTNPFHAHFECEEYLYMVEGSCEHRVGDQWVPLKAGDLMRIPAGVSHAARTLDEPMLAVIVYSSGTRDFVPIETETETE